MAGNNTANISTGSPKIGGYAYTAPKTAELPTDATTDLGAAFATLGYITEDGVTNGGEIDSEDKKDWGGTTVMSLQKSRGDTWTFTLMEALNTDVLKLIYGTSNVEGDLENGLHVKQNNTELEERVFVFEMMLKGNVKKRVVLPNAKVTAVSDVTYTNGDTIGYEVTLTCSPDANGDTHHEYLKAA